MLLLGSEFTQHKFTCSCLVFLFLFWLIQICYCYWIAGTTAELYKHVWTKITMYMYLYLHCRLWNGLSEANLCWTKLKWKLTKKSLYYFRTSPRSRLISLRKNIPAANQLWKAIQVHGHSWCGCRQGAAWSDHFSVFGFHIFDQHLSFYWRRWDLFLFRQCIYI